MNKKLFHNFVIMRDSKYCIFFLFCVRNTFVVFTKYQAWDDLFVNNFVLFILYYIFSLFYLLLSQCYLYCYFDPAWGCSVSHIPYPMSHTTLTQILDVPIVEHSALCCREMCQSVFQVLQSFSLIHNCFLAFRGYIVRKNYPRLKKSTGCVADSQHMSSCSTSDVDCEEHWWVESFVIYRSNFAHSKIWEEQTSSWFNWCFGSLPFSEDDHL